MSDLNSVQRDEQESVCDVTYEERTVLGEDVAVKGDNMYFGFLPQRDVGLFVCQCLLKSLTPLGRRGGKWR